MTRLSKKDIGKENIVFYSACTERWIWSQISVNEINFLLHSSTKLYQFDFSFGSRGPCGASHLAFVSLDSFNFEATTSQTSLYLPKSKQRCASLTWAFALARNSRLHRRVCVRENARGCVCMCLCECGCGCVCQYSTDSKATESDMTCVPAEDQPLANISEYLTPQTISRFGNDAKTLSV